MAKGVRKWDLGQHLTFLFLIAEKADKEEQGLEGE